MIRIKTFSRNVNGNNDKEINEFLQNHNVVSVKTNVTPRVSDDIHRRITNPQFVTTIIYDDYQNNSDELDYDDIKERMREELER